MCFFPSGVSLPLFPAIFYTVQWFSRKSGSFWEVPDSNPRPLTLEVSCTTNEPPHLFISLPLLNWHILYIGGRCREDREAARELRLLHHRERHLPARAGLCCVLQPARCHHWPPRRPRRVPRRHRLHCHRLGHHHRGRQPCQGSSEGQWDCPFKFSATR